MALKNTRGLEPVVAYLTNECCFVSNPELTLFLDLCTAETSSSGSKLKSY